RAGSRPPSNPRAPNVSAPHSSGIYATTWLSPFTLASTSHTATALFFHPHRGQVLEPGLGLDKALHLGAQRPRVQVMHDKHPGGILHDDLVRLCQEAVTFRRVES